MLHAPVLAQRGGAVGVVRRRRTATCPALTRLIGAADLVVLPYDSDDQVTSGVLVDAVAAGGRSSPRRSRTPSSCSAAAPGSSCPQRDAGALADVVRGLVDRARAPRRRWRRECRRLAPELSWPAVAGRYDDLAASLLRRRRGDARDRARAELRPHRRDERRHRHVRARRSLAARASPSGYCTDDMARLLIAACREPRRRRHRSSGWPGMAYRFLADAQGVDGRVRNRRSRRRALARPARRRGLLGPRDVGLRHRRGAGRPTTGCARARRRRSTAGSSNAAPWPRAMAFAALGAAEVLAVAARATSAPGACSPTPSTTIGRPGADPAGRGPSRG